MRREIDAYLAHPRKTRGRLRQALGTRLRSAPSELERPRSRPSSPGGGGIGVRVDERPRFASCSTPPPPGPWLSQPRFDWIVTSERPVEAGSV